jgi:hypothetical protein
MHYIDFILDEDYPFRLSNNSIPLSKGHRLEIAVYGTATIAILASDDWYLDGLTLKASNGKYGKDCESFDQEIFPGEYLFETIKDYLETVARERVEAEIEAYAVDLAEQNAFQAGKDARLVND